MKIFQLTNHAGNKIPAIENLGVTEVCFDTEENGICDLLIFPRIITKQSTFQTMRSPNSKSEWFDLFVSDSYSCFKLPLTQSIADDRFE